MNAVYHFTTDDDRVHSIWRVWAANIRDSRPPFEKIPAEAKETGRTLCSVLDAWQVIRKMARRSNSPRNLDVDIRLTAHKLVDRLEKLGVPLPSNN